MPNLDAQQALTKRQDLVEQGFCVIPGVLSPEFVDELRTWSDDLLERLYVDPKYRYQGSDIHVSTPRKWQARGNPEPNERQLPHEITERLIDWAPAWEACRAIGLEQQRPDDSIIVLSKPAHGPALYWHQDFMNWNSPESMSPWPTRVFISYYLTDTTRENGCLRIIPGTHHKRIGLHDQLPDAHGADIQGVEDLSHPAFGDHPDAVDIYAKAGDLVINDARVLHAAWPNQTDKRRTLLLQWHSIFDFPNPPSWWEGEIPREIREYDPSIKYEATRTPGRFLAS